MNLNEEEGIGAKGKGEPMEMKFRSVQEAFEGLKKHFQSGEISRQDFIDEMKKLRLEDEQGRFWMIGAQSGKWYYFDGKDWIQSEPPSQKDDAAICVFCGFENKLEAESCLRCGGTRAEEPSICPTCGGPLLKPFNTCPRCRPEPETVSPIGSIRLEDEMKSGILIVRGIHPVSSLLSGGLLGAFFGILLGAFAGATGVFSESLKFLPTSLFEQQGKLLGSVFLGLLGGAFGFVVFGAALSLLSFVVNFILSMSGGLKLQVGEKKASPAQPPQNSEGSSSGTGFNLWD
jgi:hypothetical protein